MKAKDLFARGRTMAMCMTMCMRTACRARSFHTDLH